MSDHAKGSSVGSTAGRSGRRDLFVALALAVLAAALVASPALAAPPTATINAPTQASYASVHLSGTVDPTDVNTYWEFEISTDGSNWSGFNYINPPLDANSGAHEVTMDLGNLEDGVTYFVRLSAFSEGNQYFSPQPNPEFTTLDLPDPAVSIDPPSSVTGTSAHFSGAIDTKAPAGNPPESEVSWHFECTPECPGLVGGTVVPDSSDPDGTTVEADTSGLKPGVAYQVTLSTRNAADSVSAGPETFTTSAIGPTLSSISAHPLYREATLNGRIDAGGAETTYHFDYGPTTAYGRSTPERTVPAGNEIVKVAADILGLAPGTAYHYHLVTDNSAGTADSGDRSFRTVANTPVADFCPNAAIRARQGLSVLPDCRAAELVNPPGLDVGDVTRVPMIGEDGRHAGWASPVLPDGALGGVVAYTAVASRGLSGWTNANANIANPSGESTGTQVFPIGFSEDFSKVLRTTALSLDPADLLDPLDELDLYRTDVGKGTGIFLSSGTSTPYMMGVNRDLTRVVYNGYNPAQEVLLWEEGSGSEVVSILPNGSIAPRGYGAIGQEQNRYAPGPPPNFGFSLAPHGGTHAVSVDATKIFFNGGDIPEWSENALYRRDSVSDTTALISGSRRAGELGEPKKAILIAASPDGDVVYFFTADPLTDASPPGGGIYRLDVDSSELTLVAGVGYGQLAGAMASDDASHLYFTTTLALAPGAESDALNAYLWTGGALTTVAAGVNGEFTRISRDGRFALFQSAGEIEGSSNDGYDALFEYDAQLGQLSCISCRPDGSPSEGGAALGAVPFATTGYTTTRNITDDGRVFFTSVDRILPGDKTSARDVYEYDSGKLSLLTEGRGDLNHYLADNTDDGQNVFILTRSPMLPQDKDAGELDLYDLRTDGGFASDEAPSAVQCVGEACQPAPPPPPAASPGSSEVRGKGNVKAKKHQKKRPHKKRNHKKKHHGKPGRGDRVKHEVNAQADGGSAR